ncbi:MAG: AI-2E family transporter [Candidatus Yonathbacteria bacterium]|nr:AI-2E family transporter [Candidatus Yonathbacteria bacterium]
MAEKNISVTITTGTIVHAILIVLVCWWMYLLRDIVLVILSSVVLASAVEPATKWFMQYKIPRVLAVLITYIIVIGAVGSLLYLFIPVFIEQVGNLSAFLPKYIEALRRWIVSSDSIYVPQTLVSDLSPSNYVETIQTSLFGGAGSVFELAGTISGGFLNAILVVVLSFYLAVQEHGIEDFLRIVAPARYEAYVVGLWKRSQVKIGKWMQGHLLLGLLIGVLVYLALTIFGIQYAILLALFAAVAELIPIFGPIISAVPAVALGFMDSVTMGVIVICVYTLIQQFESHLIYPLVVRKVVGVPPIISIIALLIGAKLAGIVGIILSVPIATVIMEFLDDVQERKRSIVSVGEKK